MNALNYATYHYVTTYIQLIGHFFRLNASVDIFFPILKYAT